MFDNFIFFPAKNAPDDPRGVVGQLASLAGSLFNLLATYVSSTFLRALRNLMYRVEFWSVPGLRATSHTSISSMATWMRHVLGPHVSCGDC